MAALVPESVLGERIGTRLQFTARERETLARAALIAARARRLLAPEGGDASDEATDTLLAEVEHAARELLDDTRGRMLAE
jgi:hypothetical protein